MRVTVWVKHPLLLAADGVGLVPWTKPQPVVRGSEWCIACVRHFEWLIVLICRFCVCLICTPPPKKKTQYPLVSNPAIWFSNQASDLCHVFPEVTFLKEPSLMVAVWMVSRLDPIHQIFDGEDALVGKKMKITKMSLYISGTCFFIF